MSEIIAAPSATTAMKWGTSQETAQRKRRTRQTGRQERQLQLPLQMTTHQSVLNLQGSVNLDTGTAGKPEAGFTAIVEEHVSDGTASGEFSLATVEKVMARTGARSSPVPQSWILLASQSTCNVVKDRKLLKDLQPCHPATMYSQGGKITINQKGKLGMLDL